ncbi:MAG: hypothetical protein ABL932_02305 [Terricaulis sp.]
MRAVFAVAALWACTANAAFAQIDPLNWCPEGASVFPAPSGNALEQAFTVQRTALAPSATFAPGEVIATLELAPAPRRRLASARDGLGIRAGDLLSPMIILGDGTDGLQNYGLAYCANVAPPPGLDARAARGRNAVCVVPARGSSAATQAFPAMLNERTQGEGVRTGRMSFGPSFDYREEWAVLGEEAPAEPAITRSLRLGRIVVARAPEVSVWNRRAFTSITAEFEVQGLQRFNRGLNQPLRIEDGWLVITGIAAGGSLEVQRMSNDQWQTFQRERCAAA